MHNPLTSESIYKDYCSKVAWADDNGYHMDILNVTTNRRIGLSYYVPLTDSSTDKYLVDRVDWYIDRLNRVEAGEKVGPLVYEPSRTFERQCHMAATLGEYIPRENEQSIALTAPPNIVSTTEDNATPPLIEEEQTTINNYQRYGTICDDPWLDIDNPQSHTTEDSSYNPWGVLAASPIISAVGHDYNDQRFTGIPTITHTGIPNEPTQGSWPTAFLGSRSHAAFTWAINHGAHKYLFLGAGLFILDYVGDVLSSAIPYLSGVPTTIGVLALCSLVLRSNRTKVSEVFDTYIKD